MMTDSFVIKEFLIENRAEVKRMCITEYDESKAKEADRQDYERELKKAKLQIFLNLEPDFLVGSFFQSSALNRI